MSAQAVIDLANAIKRDATLRELCASSQCADVDDQCTIAKEKGFDIHPHDFDQFNGGDLIEMLIEDAHTTDVSPILQASLDAHRAEPALDQREVAQVMTLWHNYQSSMLSFFNNYDVLLCPVNASTAVPHGSSPEIDGYSYTAAYNLTGWPGLVVRAGTDAGGLPIGVQILARPFREDHCIAVGWAIEAMLGEMPGPSL